MKNKKFHKSKGSKKNHYGIFWKSIIKNNQEVFTFDRALLSDYLEEKGYRKLDNFGETQVVQLINNIAYLKTSMEVYVDVLEYIKKQENNILRSCFIEQGENLLISKKAILGGLPEIELEKYHDSKEVVKLFYREKIVIIRAKKIKIISYSRFKKSSSYILSDQVIKRNFLEPSNKECDFKNFLKLVTNDSDHF